MARPRSITIICWLFLGWALVTAGFKVYWLIDPAAYNLALEQSASLVEGRYISVPLWIQIIHAFLGVPVMILSTLFMFKGRLWSLILFLFWIYSSVILTWWVSGTWVKLITALVVTFFLLKPGSYAYFRQEPREDL